MGKAGRKSEMPVWEVVRESHKIGIHWSEGEPPSTGGEIMGGKRRRPGLLGHRHACQGIRRRREEVTSRPRYNFSGSQTQICRGGGLSREITMVTKARERVPLGIEGPFKTILVNIAGIRGEGG